MTFLNWDIFSQNILFKSWGEYTRECTPISTCAYIMAACIYECVRNVSVCVCVSECKIVSFCVMVSVSVCVSGL